MTWPVSFIRETFAFACWVYLYLLCLLCLHCHLGYHAVSGKHVVSQDCPQGCQCMDGNSIYLCRYSNLTRIPNRLSSNTAIILDMDYNYIYEIRNNSLEHVPRLEIISLEYNRISSIEGSAFGKMTQLKVLSLRGNKIGVLPKDVFVNNRRLEVLDLSHNVLYNIPHEAIVYLFNLQIINVSFNSIGSAYLGMGFRYTTHLHMLDLSANQIPAIEMDSFQATIWWDETVEHFLNLSYCNIRQVHKNAFKDLNHITGLSLQGNSGLTQSNLRSLLSDTPALRLKTLDLADMNLPRLKNFFQSQKFEALNALDISRNKIKEIEAGTFTFMENLKQLDMSFNRISSIKALNGLLNVEMLDLSHNRLNKINMTTFDGLQNLKTLYLAFNNLSTLSGEPFENLWFLETWDISHNKLISFDVSLGFEHLKHISLAYNHLTELDFVRKIPRVLHIDVSGNVIATINVDTFSRGQVVSIFNASYNAITEVEPLSFHPSGLQVIDLRHNSIHHLAHFGWSSTLKELYLGYNNISYVAPNSFEGLNGLELLDLSHCGRYRFPIETFNDFYQLRKLDLSHNPLGPFLISKNVADSVFQNLEKLEEVVLSRTNLHLFPSRLFTKRITLRTIHLEGNQISSLDQADFAGLPNLRAVYLSHNSFPTVNSLAFSHLTSLEALDLSHNPFYCSCDLVEPCDWLLGSYIEFVHFHSGSWRCSNLPVEGGTSDHLPSLYTYCSNLNNTCDTLSPNDPKTIFWLVAAAILVIICIVIVIVVYKVCSRCRKKKSQKMLAKISKDMEHEQEKMIIENLKYKCNNVTNVKEEKL